MYCCKRQLNYALKKLVFCHVRFDGTSLTDFAYAMSLLAILADTYIKNTLTILLENANANYQGSSTCFKDN